MDAVNPAYIPRNQRVEEALDAARLGDLTVFESLLEVVRNPFAERADWARFGDIPPANFTQSYVTYCGT